LRAEDIYNDTVQATLDTPSNGTGSATHTHTSQHIGIRWARTVRALDKQKQ